MKYGRALLSLGDGVIDRVLCVLGTVAFSQVPEFMQQYLQRLGGHLDEARRHLAQFRDVAQQSGLTVERLIQQTGENADPAVARLGGVIAETSARVESLEMAQSAIQHASVWAKPFVFLQQMDRSIVSATWHAFRPAVPTTVEGLAYAAIGMLVLLSVYHLFVRYPVMHVARRRAPAIA